MSKPVTPQTFRKARRAGWHVVEITSDKDIAWSEIVRTVSGFSTGKYIAWFNSTGRYAGHDNNRLLGKLAFKEGADAVWANLKFG